MAYALKCRTGLGSSGFTGIRYGFASLDRAYDYARRYLTRRGYSFISSSAFDYGYAVLKVRSRNGEPCTFVIDRTDREAAPIEPKPKRKPLTAKQLLKRKMDQRLANRRATS